MRLLDLREPEPPRRKTLKRKKLLLHTDLKSIKKKIENVVVPSNVGVEVEYPLPKIKARAEWQRQRIDDLPAGTLSMERKRLPSHIRKAERSR